MESCEKCTCIQMVNSKFLNELLWVGPDGVFLYCLKSYLCEFKYLGFDFTLISLTIDFNFFHLNLVVLSKQLKAQLFTVGCLEIVWHKCICKSYTEFALAFNRT